MTAYFIILAVSIVGSLALGYWKGRAVAGELTGIEKEAIAAVRSAFAHAQDAVDHIRAAADTAVQGGVYAVRHAAERDAADIKQHVTNAVTTAVAEKHALLTDAQAKVEYLKAALHKFTTWTADEATKAADAVHQEVKR